MNQSFIYHEGRQSPEQLAEEEQSTSSLQIFDLDPDKELFRLAH
jgi:hypothetical protein